MHSPPSKRHCHCTPDNKYLSECIKDEDWCRRIYEAFPKNTRFRIERKVECYAE